MKIKLTALFGAILLAVLSGPIASAQSGISFVLSVNGTPTEADTEGMLDLIERRNQEIASENQARADRGEDPLASLPTASPAEIQSSYAKALRVFLRRVHRANIKRAGAAAVENGGFAELLVNATKAARAAARAALLAGQREPAE